ncbi:MAG: anthranilate synthase component I family protein [Lacibacter sp.]
MHDTPRLYRSYAIEDFEKIKRQMLNWCNRFNICVLLDTHQYQLPGRRYECLAACGAAAAVAATAGTALDQLQRFLDAHRGDWCFGHLAYDLKQETEGAPTRHANPVGFADLHFFRPQVVLQLSTTRLTIGVLAGNPDDVWQQLVQTSDAVFDNATPLQLQQRVSKEAYLQNVDAIRGHILRGDCYELNYCMEFFAEGVQRNPVALYRALTAVSPTPFAAFYRVHHSYLLCASPERYLKKTGNQLVSQPIKGTRPRNLQQASADAALRRQLQQNSKERSENVMVVDLVRNDLSRICEPGSVAATELFGIYSFPQVHQMISTVEGRLRPDVTFTDIIRATFPMGSMTGAPKRRVMELIDRYESSRRGIYSGAVGYISPEGDFDLNVVIRSMVYNTQTGYLSYHVGSGITWYAQPEAEYDECLLKASALQVVLQKTEAP